MRSGDLANLDGVFRPVAAGNGIGLTEAGLVYCGGLVLVRMHKTAEGKTDLAIGTDRERMLAMLSVAYGRPIAPALVMPHIEIAADLWRRGERARANLRLVFLGLPGPGDCAASHRVALAACLLDNGWPPSALLEELGLASGSPTLERYNPYHVPAHHGRRSGQFDFAPDAAKRPNGRIVVAGEEEKEFEIQDISGGATPKQEVEHHRPIQIDTLIPATGGAGFGSSAQSAVSAAARAAATNVGPGKGPVYGTKVHTELKAQVKAINRPDLHPEQSYYRGEIVPYGTRGSVRVDVAHPSAEKPQTVYDLKTGGATLSDVRREQFRTHLPKRDDGKDLEIHEIRP